MRARQMDFNSQIPFYRSDGNWILTELYKILIDKFYYFLYFRSDAFYVKN